MMDALRSQFGDGWRTGQPLDQAGVEAFERSAQVTLPEPYRSFVLEFANGAKGPPAYGLLPLGQAPDADAYVSLIPRNLQSPFPISVAWVWESEAEPDEALIESVRTHGHLPLGTDGDGMDYVLIVTGETRGQVWMISDVGAIPVAPDFASWVEGAVYPDASWTLSNREVSE